MIKRIKKQFFQAIGEIIIKKMKTCEPEEFPRLKHIALQYEKIALFFNVELE